MGITKADLDAQRAMLARGEEKRKAARQADERERLRDTFAAAALTGLLTRRDCYDHELAILAYDMADAMLRERERTNHDAAPAARASVGRPRTDKADLPTRCGTGDTPVTEPLPVFASGSGSVTPVSYEKNDEKRVFYDTKSPRNGALSGCETVPDPDSRVWETPCAAPPPHATPPQGSVQGEGSFRDSRNANEPVAWHINGSEYDTGCEYEYATLERGIAEAATAEGCAVVPLYRHPQPTLTDDEREAVDGAVWDYGQYADEMGLSVAEVTERQNTLLKLLERLK